MSMPSCEITSGQAAYLLHPGACQDSMQCRMLRFGLSNKERPTQLHLQGNVSLLALGGFHSESHALSTCMHGTVRVVS